MSSPLRDQLLRRFPLLTHVRGEAWVVGGAVRDLLLGITPHEADLCAVGAEGVARDFARETESRLVDMGRERFTTWRVVTYDAEYDFSEVEGSFEADMRRRDCTMNAVAVSIASGETFDLVGGIADAEARVIRMIREENYADDPLRVLKVVRLAVTRDCTIEPLTFEALHRKAELLRGGVAVERVTAELQKIFDDSRAHRGVELLRQLGLDHFLFGAPVTHDTLQRIRTLLEGDLVTRFAAMLWERSGDERRSLLQYFKWSETARREVDAVISVTRSLTANSGDLLLTLFDAGAVAAARAVLLLGAVGHHEESVRVAEAVRERPELFDTKPMLSGAEIQEITRLAQGPEIGRRKRELLIAQLHGRVTTREEATTFIRGR